MTTALQQPVQVLVAVLPRVVAVVVVVVVPVVVVAAGATKQRRSWALAMLAGSATAIDPPSCRNV